MGTAQNMKFELVQNNRVIKSIPTKDFCHHLVYCDILINDWDSIILRSLIGHISLHLSFLSRIYFAVQCKPALRKNHTVISIGNLFVHICSNSHLLVRCLNYSSNDVRTARANGYYDKLTKAIVYLTRIPAQVLSFARKEGKWWQTNELDKTKDRTCPLTKIHICLFL